MTIAIQSGDRRTLKAALTLGTALTAAGTVSAADLPVRMPAKAPVVVEAPFSWSGFYIGVHGGGAWLDHKQSTTQNNGTCNTPVNITTADCSLTAWGGTAGGFAGYNWQSGRVVYGLEVDGSWTGLKKSLTTPDSVGTSINGIMTITGRVDWLATARGRLGITMSPTLLYATGGVAWGGVKSSWTDNDAPPNTVTGLAISKVKLGWVVGGGIEHAFAGNWRVRVEGLYHDLGKVSGGPAFGSIGETYSTTFRHRVATVRGGLALRW